MTKNALTKAVVATAIAHIKAVCPFEDGHIGGFAKPNRAQKDALQLARAYDDLFTFADEHTRTKQYGPTWLKQLDKLDSHLYLDVVNG